MASDERMKEFKFKGRTADTFRERRTEEGVQLRKAKREEHVSCLQSKPVSDRAEHAVGCRR